MAEALRHWERAFSSRKRQCLLLNPIILINMKKFKSFSVKSMASLSHEEMAYINGGSDDRYYTSCNMDNAGAKCIYDGRHGTCDYTITYSSSGKVLYYDTFCKV